MAEVTKVIELADGTLTNMVDKDSKLPVNYKPVTTWYDGTVMDDSKVDGDLYTKKGSKYYRKVIDKDGELFLEKDTMAQMRALTPREILYLKAGVYKGVKLNGYYQEGDTPAPIIYYLSDTTEEDDGGSIFEVGGIKLEHGFGDIVDPRYYGAIAGGTADCTNVFTSLFNIGKTVDVSGNTYLIKSIDSPTFNIYGNDYNSSKIITDPDNEDKIVFTNPVNGKIKGVYFEPTQPDQQILFHRNGSFACSIKENYFREYHTVFDFRTNGNGLDIKDNYFYRGLYGVRAVLAHACYINNNRFRQQKVYSLDLESGTGTDLKSNHFMAAITMPSTIRIIGMQATFEDNYFEAYSGISGDNNDVAIIIEFNAAAHMPVFRNNLFNLKNLFNYGVEFRGTSTVNKRFIEWSKTYIGGAVISVLKNSNLNRFRNVDIKESLGYSRFNRHGFRAITEVDTSNLTTGSYKKVELYNSTLFLDNGSKSVLESSSFIPTFYESGVKYLLKIKVTYSTTDVNKGVRLGYRLTGGTPNIIDIIEPDIVSNKTVEIYRVISPPSSTSEYFIDVRKLADYGNFESVIIDVDFLLI